MLFVLLSAAMTASCITPSSGEEKELVSEEITEIISENIPGTGEPKTESAETEIPEAETLEEEMSEVETPEQEVLPLEFILYT